MIHRVALILRAQLRARQLIALVGVMATFASSPDHVLANEPPELLSFDAVHIIDDWWLFQGEIDDELPEYCIIYFGGILEGHSTMGDADGTFTYATTLSSSSFGVVTAQALDTSDQFSNVLEDVVVP